MELIKDLGLQKCNDATARRYAIFRCPLCGNEFIARSDSHAKSCGCLKPIAVSMRHTKHGMYKTRLHSIWRGLTQRCTNPKNWQYPNYGGRNIRVAEEWHSDFLAFYNWSMKNGYTDTALIDRIEVDGDYEPSNCRWVNTTISTENTRLLRSNNTSGYRGVNSCTLKDGERWRAYISHKNKTHFLGTFITPEAAAKAYNNFVIKNKTYHPLNPV